MNTFLLLNNKKDIYKRGSITSYISNFINSILNIRQSLEDLQFFTRIDLFDYNDQELIINYFESLNEYMNDYNYIIKNKSIITLSLDIKDYVKNYIFIDESINIPRTVESIMLILHEIIDFIKKYNMYVCIGIKLVNLIELYPEFGENPEHSNHQMVITKINYKEPITFIIENSWGNKNSIIKIPIDTMKDIMINNQCSLQYIYLQQIIGDELINVSGNNIKTDSYESPEIIPTRTNARSMSSLLHGTRKRFIKSKDK